MKHIEDFSLEEQDHSRVTLERIFEEITLHQSEMNSFEPPKVAKYAFSGTKNILRLPSQEDRSLKG